MGDRARGRARPPLGALLAAAAVGCAHYTPAPLDPAARAASFGERRLDAPALRAAVEHHAGPQADPAWDEAALLVVALWGDPVLARRRAEVAAARAGERTAGARPLPGVEAELGRATTGNIFESPWVASVTPAIPVEFGRKRAARLAAARARTAVAELDARVDAWQRVLLVRQAVLARRHADELAAEAARELAAHDAVVTALRAAFAAGSVRADAVVRAEADRAETAALAVRAAEGIPSADARLARALSVPVEAWAGRRLAGTAPSACDSIAPDRAAPLALQWRPDVGRALAAYAVAEGELQVEVAEASPTLQAGPGFAFDQSLLRWTLFLALPAIPVTRNRGPVAEATARRAAVAAAFDEVQQRALADVSDALAACRAARAEGAAADRMAAAVAAATATARRAYERGERGVTETRLAELAAARAARAQGVARRAGEVAGLALERAVGRWWLAPARWPDPLRDPEAPDDAPGDDQTDRRGS